MAEMANVCFFNSVKFWGGGEKLHLDYAEAFRDRNYNVLLVSRKNTPLSEKGESRGLDTFHMAVGNLSFLNLVKLLRLVRYFRVREIDTLIFSGSQDLKLGGIAAKLAGVSRIVYLRGLASPIRNSHLNRFLFNHILTHIVANSRETKKMMLRHLHTNVKEDKVKVIYHGIQANRVNAGEERKLEAIRRRGRGVILGNAGRLTRQKGQPYLVEVARRLKEKKRTFTLFIAGTGEMEADLKDLIRKNHLQEHVVLLGFVSDMEKFMKSIDIFLLPSLWEGFCFVLVEAMAESKPVVAFNRSSNPEVVVDNRTGFLVDFPDIDGFADKIEMLMADKTLRRRFGDEGRKTVLDKFQLHQRIAEFEAYLRKGRRVVGDEAV